MLRMNGRTWKPQYQSYRKRKGLLNANMMKMRSIYTEPWCLLMKNHMKKRATMMNIMNHWIDIARKINRKPTSFLIYYENMKPKRLWRRSQRYGEKKPCGGLSQSLSSRRKELPRWITKRQSKNKWKPCRWNRRWESKIMKIYQSITGAS